MLGNGCVEHQTQQPEKPLEVNKKNVNSCKICCWYQYLLLVPISGTWLLVKSFSVHLFFQYFIYLSVWAQVLLVVLGFFHCCSLQDLFIVACGASFPDQGLHSLHWEPRVLATGLAGKFPNSGHSDPVLGGTRWGSERPCMCPFIHHTDPTLMNRCLQYPR